jgi:carbamoyltransferase
VSDLILGLHAGANSSAAIGQEGRLRYCVQEERLTGIKGYMGFPHHAVTACLNHLDAKPGDITAVGYGSRFGSVEHCPPDEFLRRLQQFHRRPSAAQAEARLVARRPDGMQERVRALLTDMRVTAPVTFHDHHTTHAATAYYGLRDDPAGRYLVLTCDGFGDGACATVSVWQHGRHEEIARTDMRNSVGLLYFWATHAHGFTPHADEYKLMGMAPYANPRRAAEVADIFRHCLWLDRTGLRLARTTSASVERTWPRIAAQLRGRRFDDVFGGLQRFTEGLLTAWATAAIRATGVRRVLAGGGVFMNVKVNQRIAALPDVDTFAAFPSCGDESLPIGAYYLNAAALHGDEHIQPLADCYLGDDITDEDATAAIANSGYLIERPDDIDTAVAGLLADGHIVARCAGRMEFGARALGNRSILADPRNADLPRTLNRLVKRRDFWMPFAPAILASRQHDYLDNPKQLASPYMMMAFNTQPRAANDMIAALHPADLTCRAQIVPDDADTGLARILTAYQQRTGQAVLLNTSLNLHGQPIVRSAAEAMAVFAGSQLQYLQLGSYLVCKPDPR